MAGSLDLDSQVSEHICAFYNGDESLHEIIVDYLATGLESGHKCFCMIDSPSSVRDRVPADLETREGMLRIPTEDAAYMPDGHFSKDTFVRNMESMIQEAFADGYQQFRAVGNESFLIKHNVDLAEWFAAESELNKLAPDQPHFFFCLYDLDLFDGETVMYVLRTHPRIYVNGTVITNPYYVEADELSV